MIPAEFLADVRQGQVGQIANQVHGHLPGLGGAPVFQGAPEHVLLDGVELGHLGDDQGGGGQGLGLSLVHVLDGPGHVGKIQGHAAQVVVGLDLFYRSFDLPHVGGDVLGDVVCGGFAAPIREGYAEKVLIVTSGEKMALYAANNIKTAVDNFEDRGYARVGGIILNRRNVENEREKVEAFAEKSGIPIIADIPRSQDIIHYEDLGMTVIEGDPELEISRIYLDLAERLLEQE